MVGAGRIISLIRTPLLLHRRSIPFPIHEFHFHAPTRSYEPYRALYETYSWPEWPAFLHSLSVGGLSPGRIIGADVDDQIVDSQDLPQEFVRVCDSALAAAREEPNLLSLLPRRNIQVVVENGTPFLFRSALDTTRRMKTFLGMAAENKALGTDKAQTVDLMKYLLSYASNTIVSSDRGGICKVEPLESCVRGLFHLLSFRDERIIRSVVHSIGRSEPI